MDSNSFTGMGHFGVIVLYERKTDSLILTQRSPNLRSHPGEICFPGGGWEAGDIDLYETALRELQEELGIAKERIFFIKKLNTQKTLLGKIIHPWYAGVDSLKPYDLNQQEVARIISIPMPLVKSEKNYHPVWIKTGSQEVESCEFYFEEDIIWGATARIMKQLLEEDIRT